MSLTIICLATACMPQADTFSNLTRQNKNVEESGTYPYRKDKVVRPCDKIVTRLQHHCVQ